MMIDSLTSTEVYVEKKTVSKIIGNSKINNSGILEIDSKNNKLINEVDSGDTPLYRLSVYNGEDSLMLYNPTTKYIQLAKEGDLLNINIDFVHGTKYYIGSKMLISEQKTGNVFDVNLEGLIPLKVIMDGREIKSYSSNSTSVTILGTDRNLIDTFSKIVIYAYKNTNITNLDMNVEREEDRENTVLLYTQSSPNLFEIEYYQYDTIWNPEEFYLGDYFLDNTLVEETNCFESLSINQNVTKTVYRGGFNFSNKTRINTIDNTIDLDVFDVSNLVDLVQYVGKDEFRMILINPSFGRTVIVNNCKIDNGVSIIYDKAKNHKKFTISCGNYIDIKSSRESLYGTDRYGKGYYGGGDYIYNSHRIGV